MQDTNAQDSGRSGGDGPGLPSASEHSHEESAQQPPERKQSAEKETKAGILGVLVIDVLVAADPSALNRRMDGILENLGVGERVQLLAFRTAVQDVLLLKISSSPIAQGSGAAEAHSYT